MTVMPRTNEVRRLVERNFCEFLGEIVPCDEISETIRIEAGKVIARTFRTDDHMAMWFIEIGVVQFYDIDGNMLRTVNLLEEMDPVRAAA